MKFCVNCDNMYYIAISEEDDNKLSYYCRNCGHTDKEYTDNFVGLQTENTHGDKIYNYTINEFTKRDPTLPRIYNKECINAECPTNHEKEDGRKKPAEIIYMRYDDSNLKYAYICVECDTVWRAN